jgi:hypothetical protein
MPLCGGLLEAHKDWPSLGGRDETLLLYPLPVKKGKHPVVGQFPMTGSIGTQQPELRDQPEWANVGLSISSWRLVGLPATSVHRHYHSQSAFS